jgi:hypothetical protein
MKWEGEECFCENRLSIGFRRTKPPMTKKTVQRGALGALRVSAFENTFGIRMIFV